MDVDDIMVSPRRSSDSDDLGTSRRGRTPLPNHNTLCDANLQLQTKVHGSYICNVTFDLEVSLIPRTSWSIALLEQYEVDDQDIVPPTHFRLSFCR
jgi:hypothetical protein